MRFMQAAFGDKTFCLIMIFTIGWSSWRKEDDHHHEHDDDDSHDHDNSKNEIVVETTHGYSSARLCAKEKSKRMTTSHVHADGTIH